MVRRSESGKSLNIVGGTRHNSYRRAWRDLAFLAPLVQAVSPVRRITTSSFSVENQIRFGSELNLIYDSAYSFR